ncbi:MAG TPA: septum formation initiator family protein [Anaeromyxobacteraceae bacterium]|nr:septum formation initiator family protein [Anaeromyxobacteraceae bacterium]
MPSHPRRIWIPAYLAAVAALGAWTAYGHLSRRGPAALEEAARRLDDDNARLRQEVLRLRREARALAGDPAALERAAREDLNLVKPGETVIQLDGREGGSR